MAGTEGEAAFRGDQSGIAGGAHRDRVIPAGSGDVVRRRWSGNIRFLACVGSRTVCRKRLRRRYRCVSSEG